MGTLGGAVATTPDFAKNVDHFKNRLRRLEAVAARTRLGGGEEARERLRKRGKLPARERIARLLDPGTWSQEIGLFAAHGMYADYGGAPSAGVVVVTGRVSGRLCVIVANDATVKAGAWFPMTCKKNLRAQEIAIENRLPLIYLVDSAGVFLPLQDEVFPDKEHFGRIFRNNAVISALGIPQIAAIMGPCVAGGAYLPIMSDEVLIVKGTGSVFLAGPALVEAAIGERTDTESLGGAEVHCEISGVTDYEMEDDSACLAQIRALVAKMGDATADRRNRAANVTPVAVFDRGEARDPAFAPEEIFGILPADPSKPYSTHELLARIVDADTWDEYKAGYGKTLVCGTARIDGWAVGIVANQRAISRTRGGEMQVGGVIYSDSADKGARFVMTCNQKRIPLLFLQDVTGFMVGTRAEHGGIIKDGAKMVNAVANSVVPKITIIVGNSYGAGNYAMCGKAYDPRLIFAWPTARLAVMGGAQASKTLLSIKLAQLKNEGRTAIAPEEQARMLREIQDSYEEQTDPLHAAARLWVDAILDPRETRAAVSHALALAACNPVLPEFRTGVLQT